jgi:hypothetical protein
MWGMGCHQDTELPDPIRRNEDYKDLEARLNSGVKKRWRDKETRRFGDHDRGGEEHQDHDDCVLIC